MAYYDFWKTIGIYTDKANIEKIEKYIDLLSDCSYGFITDKMAIVLIKPDVDVDANWMLHSDERMALRWNNGTGKYYLHGVEFPEELWKKVVSGKMPLENILAIEDIDQRTQAMRYGKPKEFFQSQNAVQLDSYQKQNKDVIVDYSLWEIPNNDIFENGAMFMWYMCPSTKKEYISGVPKDKRTVAEAMAWKQSSDGWEISPEDWKQMIPLVHES